MYHFTAEKPFEDLSLSLNHKLPGYVAQYLKKFQFDGIRFLHRHFAISKSCILNDDSGLGKTLQITAFLAAVFPQEPNKKCLIIVKDEKRIMNWQFHLGVFTKFCVKVIFKKEDVSNDNIYLTKWNSLLKSTSLHDFDFDYIIVDDRDELLSNRICLSYLLKHYKNRVSLIVASNDVTMELKLFHSTLKLCGLLSKEYEELKHFEEKFSLPFHDSGSDKDVLEAYFIRREKIINFCREFRLRRYRYQYEDLLPFVTSEEYEKSLKIWKENAIKASSLSSSDSVKITSSSDRDTEELFESFFVTKEDRKLNKEVVKIMSDKPIVRRESGSEDEKMSPLLFESDSEDDALEKQAEQKKICYKRSNSGESKGNIVESGVVSKSRSTNKSKKKSTTPPSNSCIRQTRSSSLRITRSTAHRNKFLISNIFDSVKRIDRKTRKPKRSVKKENTAENKELKTEDPVKVDKDELKIFQKSLSEESKYDFKIDLINKSVLQDTQNATEMQFITPSADELIILSCSSIGEENRNQNHNTKGNVSPPDLFTTAATINGDDYNLTCTQNGSIFKQNKHQTSSKSCIVMLGKNFQNGETKAKNNLISERKEEIIFEINTTNKQNEYDVLDSTASNNTLTQIKNNNNWQNNKITKYLISAAESSSDDDFITTTTTTGGIEKMQYRRNSEVCHRTPRRQKLPRRSAVTSGKKTPKTNSNNGLTKWLIKSSEVKSPKKNMKRRRLDISFQNL